MNAYVSSFVYCDCIQTQITPQGPQPQIITPLQSLNAWVIPTHYSFTISCSIVGLVPGTENIIAVKFTDTEGNEVRKIPELRFMMPDEQEQNNQTGSLQLNLDFRNVFLKREGTYLTIIFINGENAGEYPIEVVRSKPS